VGNREEVKGIRQVVKDALQPYARRIQEMETWNTLRRREYRRSGRTTIKSIKSFKNTKSSKEESTSAIGQSSDNLHTPLIRIRRPP
jgi:hypothetical protein